MSPEQRNEAPYTPGQGTEMTGVAKQEQVPAEQRAYVARIPGLTEGRMVHYVLRDGRHRPAVVVRDWREPSGSCNLHVLLDGINDLSTEGLDTGMSREECERGIAWRTSVSYAAAAAADKDAAPCPPHTWHWPEKA